MKRAKRGAGLRELANLISVHPVRKALVMVIDRPTLLWHIYQQAGKRCGQDIMVMRYHMRKLIKAGIVKCLTPDLKGKQPGRICDLTKTGIEIKNKLCQKQKIEFNHTRLEGIDWGKYGRVILGQQRIALLRVLDFSHLQRLYEIVEKIRELHYKTHNKVQGIARQNVFNTLQWLVKEELVIKEDFSGEKKKSKPIRRYRLSDEGKLFKRQMFQGSL